MTNTILNKYPTEKRKSFRCNLNVCSNFCSSLCLNWNFLVVSLTWYKASQDPALKHWVLMYCVYILVLTTIFHLII